MAGKVYYHPNGSSVSEEQIETTSNIILAGMLLLFITGIYAIFGWFGIIIVSVFMHQLICFYFLMLVILRRF
jgi:hypothetical protein